jgi:Tfp pilus assembly protein PilF
VPVDPHEVLEALPFAAKDARSREINDLRRAISANPNDLARAVRLARLDIMLARERSDPRYLGHAQAALSPWWNATVAPVEVLVLRATIRQSLHDFDLALSDLDQAIRLAPDHVQALLTRAVVLTVRGRFPEARESCARLEPLSSPLVASVCRAQVDCVTGRAASAIEALRAVLSRAGQLSSDEEAWARSQLGECAARAGQLDEAQHEYQRTLQLDTNDAYARAALSDLLLDRGRAKEALAIVEGRDANDTLLLRIALAEKRLGAPQTTSHVDALAARFDASRLRGDVVHRREEARFWLDLKDSPSRALPLAVANWEVQREPADVRILLDSARAARQPRAAAAALAWLDETKLEDPFIAKTAAELRAMGTR